MGNNNNVVVYTQMSFDVSGENVMSLTLVVMASVRIIKPSVWPKGNNAPMFYKLNQSDDDDDALKKSCHLQNYCI